MSQVNFVDAFIKLIGFYGFRISEELVNRIITNGKIKLTSKIQPLIGIHFYENCYCLLLQSSNRSGWSHHCSAYGSNVYLNNEFRSKMDSSGKVNSRADAKYQIAGIFINFQV